MRKLFNFLFISVFALLLISCNAVSERYSDDLDSSANNSINYFQVDGGAKLAVTAAVLQGLKSTTTGVANEYTLLLTNGDTSSARLVHLEIEFPYNQTINGTYTLGNSTRPLTTGTGYMEVNTSGSTSDIVIGSTGTFTIKRNSTDNITASFSIKLTNGKTISGQYSGNVVVQEQ